MLGYLSADIVCSEKRTVFREENCELRGTDNVEVKWRLFFYIFYRQIEAIVYYFHAWSISNNNNSNNNELYLNVHKRHNRELQHCKSILRITKDSNKSKSKNKN